MKILVTSFVPFGGDKETASQEVMNALPDRLGDAALEKLVKVPRVFLPTVLKGCVKWAEENGVKVIDVREMEIINDKRSKEKGK